jgi:hypothetical protein
VPGLAAQPAGHTPREVELPGGRVYQPVEFSADAAVRAGRRPHHDALEMGGQRTAARPVLAAGSRRGLVEFWRSPTARRHSSKASRTSASQKSILIGRRRGPFGSTLETSVDPLNATLSGTPSPPSQ